MKPYYDQDGITIYHGDCREVIPQLEPVDLVVTSPPYNLSAPGGSDFTKLDNGYGPHDDSMPHSDYVAWQQDILTLCWDGLSDVGAIFYNHKPRPNLADGLKLPIELVPPHIPIRQIIIWDRLVGYIQRTSMFVPSHEWILLLAKPAFRLTTVGTLDVWRVSVGTGSDHPAPFPVGIPKRCIAPTSAQLILDPFMGSGSTLRAAKDLGRRAIGIEVNERYCEMAVNRLAQGVLAFE